MARSNYNKAEKRPEKIILWRRHHLRLDVTIRKEKSTCRHAEEVVDTVAVALIFNRAAIEKTNPPYLLAVAEEEKEINHQYQKNLV